MFVVGGDEDLMGFVVGKLIIWFWVNIDEKL